MMSRGEMPTGEDAHGSDYFTPVFLLPQLCNSTEKIGELVLWSLIICYCCVLDREERLNELFSGEESLCGFFGLFTSGKLERSCPAEFMRYLALVADGGTRQ